jgi:predicted RNA-binding Zn ribbon-like protein
MLLLLTKLEVGSISRQATDDGWVRSTPDRVRDRERGRMSSESAASFPPDWLDARGGRQASDLDLAVLLVNTIDLLEDPPDRLVDLAWITSALAQVGHREIVAHLDARDLPRLRELRDALRRAFEASDAQAAADVLNPQLLKANAVALVVVAPEGPNGRRVSLDVGAGRTGADALCARLPAAVAVHIAAHGLSRLGVCNSDPCRCAFVDRTRAGTRRYCCRWCNDRAAARAYRARKRS